eukprot:6211394-Pleurochrysis_carterae.AAC.2
MQEIGSRRQPCLHALWATPRAFRNLSKRAESGVERQQARRACSRLNPTPHSSRIATRTRGPRCRLA